MRIRAASALQASNIDTSSQFIVAVVSMFSVIGALGGQIRQTALVSARTERAVTLALSLIWRTMPTQCWGHNMVY